MTEWVDQPFLPFHSEKIDGLTVKRTATFLYGRKLLLNSVSAEAFKKKKVFVHVTELAGSCVLCEESSERDVHSMGARLYIYICVC